MFASVEMKTSFEILDQRCFLSEEIKSRNKPDIHSPLATTGYYSSTKKPPTGEWTSLTCEVTRVMSPGFLEPEIQPLLGFSSLKHFLGSIHKLPSASTTLEIVWFFEVSSGNPLSEFCVCQRAYILSEIIPSLSFKSGACPPVIIAKIERRRRR